MSHVLPSGWVEFGSNGDNSVTFLRPGHTVTEPRLAIFSRKPAVAQANGNFSVPEYRVRLFDGHVDTDGLPKKDKAIVEVVIRLPVGDDATPTETSLAALAAMLADAAFVTNATVDLMWPREAVA